jgi:hypothetical protein
MNLGLRALLLALAIVLFVIGAFSDIHQGDLICWGLAAAVASVLVGELGLETRMNLGGTRSTT